MRLENLDKKDQKGKLPTGHFHINKIQDESIGEDLNAIEMKELLDIVKKALSAGIKGI